MLISVATANFYSLPFDQALEIIAEAGFEHVELDLYWERGEWAVFHTPHIEGDHDEGWWHAMANEFAKAAESYRSSQTSVTVENMALFDGYHVPLTDPRELLAFVSGTELGITLDTTHYAQIGVDVVWAAGILRDKVRTIHLSDYADGEAHVFIGDGDLDLEGFLRALELARLHSVTLECSVGLPGEAVAGMTRERMIDRLKTARKQLQNWVQAAQD